jgi:hypothetical protein
MDNRPAQRAQGEAELLWNGQILDAISRIIDNSPIDQPNIPCEGNAHEGWSHIHE